jgi:GNAT superfamily N-acetyltransferase
VALRIESVPARVTWPLRQAVLRPHQTIEQLRLPSDDLVSTRCFAAFDEAGEVIGTSQVALEDPAFDTAGIGHDVLPSWRLRGMATRADARGSGVGTALIGRVIDYVAGQGGRVLWCHARLPAVNFYARAGFRTYGVPWEEPDIGPHVVMWRSMVGPSDDRPDDRPDGRSGRQAGV